MHLDLLHHAGKAVIASDLLGRAQLQLELHM